MIGTMARKKTFAEIAAEAMAEPKPERDIRLGGVNKDGEFFDLSGNLLIRIGEVTPKKAQEFVADGASVVWEGCGCGGSSGCPAQWIEARIRDGLGSVRPRFVKGYGSPTWIDLWEGDGGFVVYAHGDVEWGDAFG